jgi:hypothetical protein
MLPSSYLEIVGLASKRSLEPADLLSEQLLGMSLLRCSLNVPIPLVERPIPEETPYVICTSPRLFRSLGSDCVLRVKAKWVPTLRRARATPLFSSGNLVFELLAPCSSQEAVAYIAKSDRVRLRGKTENCFSVLTFAVRYDQVPSDH